MLTGKYYAKIVNVSQTYTTLFSHRGDGSQGRVFDSTSTADRKRSASRGYGCDALCREARCSRQRANRATGSTDVVVSYKARNLRRHSVDQ